MNTCADVYGHIGPHHLCSAVAGYLEVLALRPAVANVADGGESTISVGVLEPPTGAPAGHSHHGVFPEVPLLCGKAEFEQKRLRGRTGVRLSAEDGRGLVPVDNQAHHSTWCLSSPLTPRVC
ncbi:unnamed protein product, partial [Ectocarpus sp. 6 AP-2014]